MTGTLSELVKQDMARRVHVPAAVLEKYVGTYDLRFPENPTTPMLIPFSLDGDQLVVGGAPLIPLSPTTFGGPVGRIAFVTDERGVATRLLLTAAEGDLEAVRLPDAK